MNATPKTVKTPAEASTMKPHKRAPKERKSKPSNPPSVRKGTKTAKILSLLHRPDGATLKELKKASGWQAHSVRGFLSGALKKRMGWKVDSTKREDGARAYRIASK